MSRAQPLSDLITQNLKLHRLDDNPDAGLLLCSLPVPPGAPASLAIQDCPTFNQPLGQWPGSPPDTPRRILLAADNDGPAPDTLHLTDAPSAPSSPPPEAEAELFAKSDDPAFMWERHCLRISWKGNSVGIAMGLRTKGEVHWWEQCRLVERSSDPNCRVVEMGGAIPHVLTTGRDLIRSDYYVFPFLHKHNWLNGNIVARLHSNGVCEIFAHHINSKFADDGLPLEDAVPVIGIRIDDASADLDSLCGPWDGSREEIEVQGVRYWVRDVARLASPEQPGSIDRGDDFLVWQPYEGMELFGGLCPLRRLGEGYIFHSKEKIIPRGMARTLRFSLSLSPDRHPRVARYLPPAWWYGTCEEILPDSLLTVRNEYDASLDACREWIRGAAYDRGFEDGSIPRHDSKAGGKGEAGWEGEVPYGQILGAWLSGNPGDYDIGLRACYHLADVAVDHAAFAVRMHGYPPNAFAVPMQRIHALLVAYLETGDPYLLSTGKSVLDTAYWTHKNSWPRMAVGRDACFIRGAVALYRYLGDVHYIEMARDASHDVAASQLPGGAFGDQGGGTGIHGSNGYVVKPWMGLMAVGGLVDYLELADEDPVILGTVKKFGDWLMRERAMNQGAMGWRYQHYYAGSTRYYDHNRGEWTDLTEAWPWHQDYLARLLTFCSLRFDDASYFDAWAESYSNHPEKRQGDHAAAQSYQYLPWVQGKLWNAKVTEDGVECEPLYMGERTPSEGTIQTPEGPATLRWTEDHTIEQVQGPKVSITPRTIPQNS